jgi:hypothetical protein
VKNGSHGIVSPFLDFERGKWKELFEEMELRGDILGLIFVIPLCANCDCLQALFFLCRCQSLEAIAGLTVSESDYLTMVRIIVAL